MSFQPPSPYQGHPAEQFQSINKMERSFQQVSIINRSSASPAPIQNTKKKMAKNKQESRDAKVVPSAASGGIPTANAAYMAVAHQVPRPLKDPQHILVVIDLNGTLLFRPSRTQPTKFVARPHTLCFLSYCIDTFTVVIWSSARPENVANMCRSILNDNLKGKVAAIWGRERFELSPSDYNLRVQCYKRLTKLWTDPQVAQSHPAYHLGQRWDQTNTVLVDDSIEKGQSEPYNLIEIPEFTGNHNETGDFLPQVHDYLNQLSMHSNVSAYLREHPFKAMPLGRS